MKRSILYMGSLCLLLALGGCRGDDRAAEPAAPASAAPTPTVAVRLETETPAVTPEVLEALTKGEPDMTPVLMSAPELICTHSTSRSPS